MTNVDVAIRLTQLSGKLENMTAEITELKKGFGINELWDNADMIRNWKVSERTLATWRQEGLIGYVKVGGKIWYPLDARNEFLKLNFIKTKKEED